MSDKVKKTKKPNNSWKNITKTQRESIERSIDILEENLKKINTSTLPNSIKVKLNSFTNQEKLNKKLSLKISELKLAIEELKLAKIKDAETYKEKAIHFGHKAQAEIKKFKEKFYKKNEETIQELQKYKSAEILEQILPEINSIKMAINVGKKQDSYELKNYLVGFEMLLNQLEAKLFDEGVSLINPKIGDNFDPKFQTALSTIKSKKQKNKIIEVKKYGYMLHDRVLIPAIVIIGK